MRILSLLVALQCGLVAVCSANDQPGQISSPRTAGMSSDSERFDVVSGVVRPDFSEPGASDRADRDYRGFDSPRDGDLTCYTIESFLVKRESPRSDVTEPVGHSTCQRASKYGVKKAEEPGKAFSH